MSLPGTTRRVVVTGLGAVTPCGATMEATWRALVAGRSGIGRVQAFPADDLRSRVAGECRDFVPDRYIDPKTLRHSGRFIHLALAASEMAVEDAGAPFAGVDPRRVAVFVGVGMGSMDDIVASQEVLTSRGPRKISPYFIPSAVSNLAAGHVAIRFDARGPSFCPTSACTSGAHAIGEAFDQIRLGRVDVALAGGAEGNVNRLTMAGFDVMRALATRNDPPSEASRPFDQARDGFVLSEGAATLVLEERDAALRRGARVLAEIRGYGSTTDAYHITHPAPEGRGLAEAMEVALEDAGLAPEAIDYVNAHATSTPVGDAAEASAIVRVFGAWARSGLWVSSTKSMTGHLLGASGALEAAVCARALQEGVVPPTVNLHTPDPKLAGPLDLVPHEAREKPLRAVLSNSTGFGGHNAALVLTPP